ncbi:site-specific integrase [Bradyrhizobium sp. Ash2021]|uniref:tyrosine-type recombinase/integrase n=1 Tax=Bradyrhizobium sp. Ash2021 TaxID=2954771 RepID=UPI002814F7E4|nr:site-specific integrase [Bradyrhizobium sp. Ash2021]WMT78850.1 site-specific integrase [Bradyrhizobium sp. Ash2021]
MARGVHTPGSISPTVKDAGALWIKRCNEKNLEATTIDAYEQHVDLHIAPFIGAKKLSDMTVPAVNAFADQLRDGGRSAAMIKKVIRSLGSIFKEARRRGLSSVAPTVGIDLDLPERDDPRPVIPTKAELQAIIAGATARKSRRWRALVLVATFCGLRASELRGLRWVDVDFEARQIHVNQRADASHKIGKLKSKAAYRSLRMPPMVLNALREWKLACPKGDLDLVFPNGIGKVESYANLIDRGFAPIQIGAGITAQREALDEAGKPVTVTVAKYGLHALRHACASLWIEQGHNPKQIQTLMGHSSIKVTFDTYGHLFADSEADQRAAEGVELRLLGS